MRKGEKQKVTLIAPVRSPNICMAEDEMKLLGAPVSTMKVTGATEGLSCDWRRGKTIAGRDTGP